MVDGTATCGSRPPTWPTAMAKTRVFPRRFIEGECSTPRVETYPITAVTSQVTSAAEPPPDASVWRAGREAASGNIFDHSSFSAARPVAGSFI